MIREMKKQDKQLIFRKREKRRGREAGCGNKLTTHEPPKYGKTCTLVDNIKSMEENPIHYDQGRTIKKGKSYLDASYDRKIKKQMKVRERQRMGSEIKGERYGEGKNE